MFAFSWNFLHRPWRPSSFASCLSSSCRHLLVLVLVLVLVLFLLRLPSSLSSSYEHPLLHVLLPSLRLLHVLKKMKVVKILKIFTF